MTAAAACRACGLGLREGARFCDGCGAPVSADPALAEFKQVTIMFADVVRSMDIAARVGPERLREIMTDLFARSREVVERSGGTLNSYTGDGIMALFGAPVALEDHAFRACVAAMDLQREAEQLGADVMRREGVVLRLRVGINSGQVIAGEVSPTSYTAVGDQVGFVQRMESVAPADLVDAELIGVVDSVGAEYAFRHPLIRAVAYETPSVQRLLAIVWAVPGISPAIGRPPEVCVSVNSSASSPSTAERSMDAGVECCLGGVGVESRHRLDRLRKASPVASCLLLSTPIPGDLLSGSGVPSFPESLRSKRFGSAIPRTGSLALPGWAQLSGGSG